MSKHRGPDFGDISEDQSPEEITKQVEAAYVKYGKVEVVAHTYRVPMLDTYDKDEAFCEAVNDEFDGDVQDIHLSIDGGFYITIYSSLDIATHASRLSMVRLNIQEGK